MARSFPDNLIDVYHALQAREMYGRLVDKVDKGKAVSEELARELLGHISHANVTLSVGSGERCSPCLAQTTRVCASEFWASPSLRCAQAEEL